MLIKIIKEIFFYPQSEEKKKSKQEQYYNTQHSLLHTFNSRSSTGQTIHCLGS